MSREPLTVGIQPWFPGRLGRWGWLVDPIPAERAAALRIAVAVVLLLDIGLTYLPHYHTLFSPDALGGPDVHEPRFRDGHFMWSVLRLLPSTWGPAAVLGVWAAASFALLIGWRPLVSGLLAWACAVSVYNIQFGCCNGGDRLRATVLLCVALSNGGAVWGVSAVRRAAGQSVLVPAWPLRVLFVQLAVLYFFSGVYKGLSPAWRTGYVMYFVNHDLAWSTMPTLAGRLPVWAHQLSAWTTVVWELGFPVLAVLPATRKPTLWLGVFFHLGTFVTLEVSHFALYATACYAAFVPWERYRSAARAAVTPAPARSSAAAIGSAAPTR